MKTTIDIPDDTLKEAMKNTGATTKREAVVAALDELNRLRRLRRLAAKLGKSDTFMSYEELMKMREQSKFGGKW